jgi:hypothetical protein
MKIQTVCVVLFIATMGSVRAADIDEHICPRCEDIVPVSARMKHLGGLSSQPQDPSKCDATCRFDTKPPVTVHVTCGKAHVKLRMIEPGAYNKETDPELKAYLAREPWNVPIQKIPDLETRAYLEREPYYVKVAFSDRDTPCSVEIAWEHPGAEAKAIALARDVAAALTPAVTVDKPTFEAIVWNVDENGDKAKSTLTAWDREKSGVNAVLQISPGFPKLVEASDRAGLPTGKKLLVFGYCPNWLDDTEAGAIIQPLDSVLPGVGWYRVDGRGVSASCPTIDKQRKVAGAERRRVGEFDLSALVLQPKAASKQHQEPVSYVYAYLRDSAGRLVDFKSLNARVKTANQSSECARKLKADGNAVAVQTTCNLEKLEEPQEGLPCKVPPTAVQTTLINVVGGMLKLTTSSKRIAGREEDCNDGD